MREGYELYYGYLLGYEEEVSKGNPLILEVRDLQRLERKIVRAIITRSPSSIADGQELWVRDINENYLAQPWSIKIIEGLNPDEIEPQRRDIDQNQWITKMREEATSRGGRNFAHYGADGLASSYFLSRRPIYLEEG